MSAGGFTREKDKLIHIKRETTNLTIPQVQIEQLKNFQGNLEKKVLKLPTPEEIKDALNGLINTRFPAIYAVYSSRLDELSIDEQLFGLIRAIREATAERK